MDKHRPALLPIKYLLKKDVSQGVGLPVRVLPHRVPGDEAAVEVPAQVVGGHVRLVGLRLGTR